MTKEELWELFPIVLTEHRDEWAQWYEEEAAHLASLLPSCAVINHIGSTAVEGIWAKPIVDILVELPDEAELRNARDILVANGYLCMSEQEERISLNKGYTESGFAERVFHLHLRLLGDRDEMVFRDFLNANPDKALEYESLKLGLWKGFEHDRDGYTEAKTGFIEECMDLARSGGHQ